MIYKKLLKLSLIIAAFSVFNTFAEQEKATIIFASQMNEIALKGKGGYPALATLLTQYRKQNDSTFFIFGGGSLGPSALSSLDRGTHIIDLLNSLEPDVMGITKRDFSFLEDELSLRSYEAAFPFIASNTVLKNSKDNLDGLNDSIIIQQGKYKIGILSILGDDAIIHYGLKNIDILPPEEVVEDKAKRLREQGADLVILLSSGISNGLYYFLENNIVDLILQKNIRGFVSSNEKDIQIKKPDEVAVVQLNWLKGQPESLKVNWQAKSLVKYEKSPEILEQVKSYNDRLFRLLNKDIGKTSVEINTIYLNVRTKENAFANLMADAAREYSRADVALVNGGSIRGNKTYQANQVLSRKDIAYELPFRGEIILIEVSGKQLSLALEHGLGGVETVEGRFLHVSGLKVVYNSQASVGNRLLSVMVNGIPLRNDKMYKVATTEFLAKGGDGYTMFKQNMHIKHDNQMSKLFVDIVTDYIENKKIIVPKISGRLVDISQKVNKYK